MTRPGLVLVLGGARSGKSRYAESLCARSGLERIYVATATAGDAEMAARIERHRRERGTSWTTVEEPLALGAALGRWRARERIVLVECLTLWLTNLLVGEHPVEPAVDALLAELGQDRGPVVLVSNEVGLGVVPMNALARRFVDDAGRLHQRVAALADRVALLVAGLPLVVKEGRSA
jgi:adenosylcobinamide kinase/adenosylcobinamide-phosphate guanylyltransferase